MPSAVDGNGVLGFELRGGQHTDRVPGELSAHAGTDLATDALVEANLHRGIGRLSYTSPATASMQSTGQNGTHT